MYKNRSMHFIVYILFIILFAVPVEVNAADQVDKLIGKMGFLTESQEITAENGAIIRIQSPVLDCTMGDLGNRYYTVRQGLLNVPYTITVNGFSVVIKNPTNKVVIVKWAESAVAVGDFSGTPFLDGMKYKDAGNPSATPDSLIPPGQSVVRDANISRVQFKNKWSIVGVPITKDNSVKGIITLKLLDDKGRVEYISVTSPCIGIVTK